MGTAGEGGGGEKRKRGRDVARWFVELLPSLDDYLKTLVKDSREISMADTVRTIIVSGLFALAGAFVGGAMTGYSNVKLAKQKLNSDLVLRALESNSPDERLQALQFMSRTNLISDESIREGVLTYTRDSGDSIPQIVPTTVPPPVIEHARIFVLAGTDAKVASIESYASELSKAGFQVVGHKRLWDQGRPDYAEVRYFNGEDRIQAEKLADFLKLRLSDSRVQAMQLSDTSAKPGYIELWLGR
jgi:hypothetical protein